MRGERNKPTLCWDCRRAGFCKKPVAGWEAEYRPVKMDHVGKGKRVERWAPSWRVARCPRFAPERWVSAGREEG